MNCFMTAREIAEAAKRLDLSCMPHTKRSVNARAKREGWADRVAFCRKRDGSVGGGGLEYDVYMLPDQFRIALRAEVLRRGQTERVSRAKDEVLSQILDLDPSLYTSRQIQTAIARFLVVTVIDRFCVENRMTQSSAIDAYLACRAELSISDRAGDQTNAQQKVGTSRSTLFCWMRAWEESGFVGLVPSSTAANT